MESKLVLSTTMRTLYALDHVPVQAEARGSEADSEVVQLQSRTVSEYPWLKWNIWFS